MWATMPCMAVVRDSGRSSVMSNKAMITAFGVLAVLGILLTGTYDYLFKGDQRVMVVTLQQGVQEPDRDTLKQACGTLPGVTVVADQGAADKQYRLPVRFRIANTTQAQEAALQSCIAGFPRLVRGFEVEGDGV